MQEWGRCQNIRTLWLTGLPSVPRNLCQNLQQDRHHPLRKHVKVDRFSSCEAWEALTSRFNPKEHLSWTPATSAVSISIAGLRWQQPSSAQILGIIASTEPRFVCYTQAWGITDAMEGFPAAPAITRPTPEDFPGGMELPSALNAFQRWCFSSTTSHYQDGDSITDQKNQAWVIYKPNWVRGCLFLWYPADPRDPEGLEHSSPLSSPTLSFCLFICLFLSVFRDRVCIALAVLGLAL